jgi:hypothetical protein
MSGGRYRSGLIPYAAPFRGGFLFLKEKLPR